MMKLFDAYRKQNTEPQNEDYCDIDFLLRFWRENKGKYLAPLFGDKLILEKEVEYARGRDQLREDMYQMVRTQFYFMDRFTSAMRTYAMNEHDREFDIVVDNISASLRNSENLVDNKLYLGYVEYENDRGRWDYKDIKAYTFTFEDGAKVQLQMGMKITRAMTQLCAHIGLSDAWEQFRIKHSQVLNQKKLKGTLCLSIHPLDYATASDNDNGWSSCMSWRENGCYRLGTVEMMNSPMVICAYLKSEKQHMSILDEDDWNSKKWRAWIIVTKDVIICNRHYPYHQEHFAIKAIEWVRELVGEKYGWEYDEIHTDFIQYERDVEIPVEFHTNYMYNDIGGDDVIGCFKKGAKMSNMPGVINFSGPAECMCCGAEIFPEHQEADTLLCGTCNQFAQCEECGCDLDEDQCYTGPDGNTYCEECYNELFRECEECGSVQNRDDCKELTFPLHQEAWDEWMTKTFGAADAVPDRSHPAYRTWYRNRWSAGHVTNSIWLCPDCARRLGVTDIEFRGDTITVPDPKVHSMNSAYDLVNLDDWHWANHINEISWVDDDDRNHAKYTIELCKINWRFFIKKNFPHLVPFAAKVDNE